MVSEGASDSVYFYKSSLRFVVNCVPGGMIP